MLHLPGYQITEKIYESPITTIYRGQRVEDRKLVILKTLASEHPSISSIATLNHEAKILKKQNFEGAPRFLEMVQHQSAPILILEDFEGIALSLLYDSKPMELNFFLNIAIQISEELGKIHQEHVIHKDINPSNLIFNSEINQVQIIDFGISSLLSRESPHVRSPERIEGTLAYISPEQTGRMNRSIDYRTDFYSLGVTFYELLTGQKPFVSQDLMEMVHCHIAKNPLPISKLNPQVPQYVEDIVMKLSSKTPEERYQGAYGLKKDLERCLEGWKQEGKITGVSLPRFKLGEEDLSEQFHIPEKLYGREKEIAVLLNTFLRVRGGKSEMMLIAGDPGIGKSVLVNEVQKPIVQNQGYFVSGKFDQFKREIPFSALIQVFQELIQQLLTENRETLKRWREQIQTALTPNAQLMIEVIPQLELIIGKQPEIPTLPPTESQNRFNLYIRKFVEVFSSKEHPLVIFLDDLQWADNASLDLVKLLITDPDSGYLLLIGAYRDNEVTPIHPLMLTLDAIQTPKGIGPSLDGSIPTFETITLKTLSVTHVSKLISETLHCKDKQARPLAQLIIKKTNGNPFFTKEFLINLYRENLLQFDQNQGNWQWDLEEIQSMDFTDNVVDLMTNKIQLLSNQAQQVLKLAACIGNQFDLGTLSVAYEQSPHKTAQSLWETLEKGLILPLGDNYRYIVESKKGSYQYTNPNSQKHVQSGSSLSSRRLAPPKVVYKFLHDRVQQATYKLLSEKEKEETHLQIGRLMLTSLGKTELEENLIQVVNHMNFSIPLIQGIGEKCKLARMNWQVGLKAKDSTAYLSASKYFKIGVQLLTEGSPPEIPWEEEYSLTFQLYKERIECEYLIGHFEEAERLIEMLLQHTSSIEDQGELYLLRTLYYLMAGRLHESIQMGRKGLKLFQIDLPLDPNNESLEKETKEIEENMQEKQISDLASMPLLKDQGKLICLLFLSHMFAPTYISANIKLMSLIILKMTNIAMKYGETSGNTYAFYALYLVTLQNYKDAYDFGQVALKISPDSCRANYLFGSIIAPWRIHLKHCLPYLQSAVKSAMSTGDLTYARYTVLFLAYHTYFKGVPLQQVDEVVERYSPFLEESEDPLMIGLTRVNRLVVQALTINPIPFDNKIFDEKRNVEIELPSLHNPYYINKAQISFLFENYKTSLYAANEAEKTLGSKIGHITHVTQVMYLCLSITALYPEYSKEEQEQAWNMLKTSQDQMKTWAENCPDNFLHKYLLVSAEIARISNNGETAMTLYEEAIEKAKDNEYLQDVALANELAAKYYLSRKVSSIAKVYMREARYWYHRWGATLKVKQLDEKYRELLTSETTPKILASQSRLTSTTISSSLDSFNLDLDTVLKSSQAISSEIDLEQLLKKMMTILIENAGAQKGYLILNKGNKLFIEAEGKVGQDSDLQNVGSPQEVVVLQSIPIELEGAEESSAKDELPLPTSILSYVIRTQKEVILEEALQTKTYSKDPYIAKYQPKSVMCVPIIHQGEVNGLIYLENNLTTGAFTKDHLKILELLSGQAAISMENAQLYNTLEQKVEERTIGLENALKQLKETQSQLVNSEKMASLGILVAGIAHEINNPTNFVLSGAQNIERRLKQLHDFIFELAEEEKEQITKLFQPKFDQLYTNLEAVLEGSRRINNVVINLKTFSRLDESVQTQAKIIEGLQSTLGLIEPSYREQVEFEEIYEAEPLLTCWPAQLNQVFMNVMINGCQAIVTKRETEKSDQLGKLTIHTYIDQASFIIRFQDTGIGIPNDKINKIFDPFFSTKSVGEGTGLGLSISYGIIEKHQGSISVDSVEGEGTEITIRLPFSENDQNSLLVDQPAGS